MPFLREGIAVLIEKPIALSVAEADELIEAADRSGAILAAGHTERFNPAVTVARALIKDPRFVEVHRLGVFPERSLDIDVIFDLMIHDLDLLLALVGSEVTSVDAVGVAVLTPKADITNVRIRFASGCIALDRLRRARGRGISARPRRGAPDDSGRSPRRRRWRAASIRARGLCRRGA
jgi:predicted dehydrogenase